MEELKDAVESYVRQDEENNTVFLIASQGKEVFMFVFGNKFNIAYSVASAMGSDKDVKSIIDAANLLFYTKE